MSSHPVPGADATAAPRGTARKLTVVVLGLAALVTVMLCAFALPNVNGAPHDVPVGVTGPAQVTRAAEQKLDDEAWDVTVYDSPEALKNAVRDREAMGGLALGADGVDVYTATAAGPSIASALTAMGNGLATQQHTRATAHDVVSFPADDPRGAGFSSAALPMIFGGIFPAVILSRLFPGHQGLRTRIAGVLLFSLVAGAAVAAFLQFGTGSLDGNYGLTSLGLALGMAALSTTFIGLEAVLGFAGLGAGAGVMMLLGNPLSGLATGPHMLPAGWAALGQALPPGASGSLLRANAFFDGTGALVPALTLAAWIVFGLALALVADRRAKNPRRAAAQADASDATAAAVV
ncbi:MULTISPECIES: hypothetical protein [unclassified Streptomyces]|uniref:hypothetical protein n=1 Tax=unclassified Streptomyces TaxID=2593676 RepID=UPI002E19DA13